MKKTIIIGLDALTFDIIQPLIEKGLLPNLAKFINNGAHSKLETTIPSISASAWVSFSTGVNPGKHGIFFFFEDIKGNQSKLISSKGVKFKRIWHYLDEYKLKSCFINLPVTYPLEKINGVMVSSFLTPPGADDFTYPLHIKKDLDKVNYKIDLEFERYAFMPHTKLTGKKKKKFYYEQIEITKNRAEAAKLLIKKYDFDLFFVLFRGTDEIQHIFMDNEQILTSYFQLIDNKLKEIIDVFKKKYDDFTLFIISDHGHALSPKINFNIYKYLADQNILKKKKNEMTLTIMKKVDDIFKKKIGLDLSEILPFFSKYYSKKKKKIFLKEKINIFEKGIFINRNIIKDPDIEEKLKKKIIKLLKNVEYKEKKVFDIVTKAEDIYSGPYSKKGFDIVYVINKKFAINNIPNKNLFFKNDPHLIGSHDSSIYGIFIAYGKDINKIKFKNAKLIDLLPTILHIYNIPIPQDVDGKVLKEIFKKKSILYKKKIKKEKIKKLKKNQKGKKKEKEIEIQQIKEKIKKLKIENKI